MQLEVSTPEKILFHGEVYSVQWPGKDGLFQVLDHHAPMIAISISGRVKYEVSKGSAPQYIDINRGVVQVLDNTVTILSE